MRVGRSQASESWLECRRYKATASAALSVLNSSEDGELAGSSMMVITRQSEERGVRSAPEHATCIHIEKQMVTVRKLYCSGLRPAQNSRHVNSPNTLLILVVLRKG